jgi:hypothetical protein
MSTPATTANSILDLIYRAIAWADMAQNDGSAPATVLDIGLHTNAPATALQSSNEATFGSYARVSINRDASGWTAASGGSLSNLSTINFTAATSGPQTITHVSVGYGGTIIHYGALVASRTVDSGISLQFAASALVSSIT